MGFRISGLPVSDFEGLFRLAETDLAQRGVERVRIETPHAAPCRIMLEDAEPGETVLLLNHEHQPADTPYRSRHAIFVREIALKTFDAVDAVPDAIRRRLLSVRAFDEGHRMVDADVVEGSALEALLEPMLAHEDVAYVHLHYARRGCFAARAERA